MKKLVLDFGHGAQDQGTQGINISEAAAITFVGNLIKHCLEGMYEVDVILTRENNSQFLELSERANIAITEMADAFVSLHYNSFDTTATGFESFRHSNSVEGSIDHELQKAIHSRVSDACIVHGLRDRGMKQANYQVLRELQETGIPAVLLEGLFIDNPRDIELLFGQYSIDYAICVAEGIAEFLDLPEYVVPEPQLVRTAIEFNGKTRGDGDNTRLIKYTGSYSDIVSPDLVVTEVGGGYEGASAAGGTTCFYQTATAGKRVQFVFEFDLSKYKSIQRIDFVEKAANTSSNPRNGKQKIYAWNVASKAWTNGIVKFGEDVGLYYTLTLANSIADYVDKDGKIRFALLSHDQSDENPIRVETDHVLLKLEYLN